MAKQNEQDKKETHRETWKRNFDYILSIMGMMVGLGNVWRFPYLCYKNGGGAFLIPYCIFFLFVAWPIIVFEAALGQYSGHSSVLCWSLVPIMNGIGYLSPVLLSYSNIYYPVVLTWSLRWLLASFSSVLPWTNCNNTWNTEECIPIMKSDDESTQNSSVADIQAKMPNTTGFEDSSTEEFWKYRVLGLTSGIEDQGSMNWDLLGCLVIIWILTYFAIWKGIGWTSKIIYFTATFPLVMIIVVLIRGVTLPGAQNGINLYLKPNLTKLQEIGIWNDAASQVLYSCTLGFGIISCMSRYNKFNQNFFRDSIILVLANSFASFLSGFAIFSILGFLAEVKNATIEDVAESGPGLVFVAYPTALSFLPFPQLWSALFFVTIILLGFDGQFMYQESFVGCLRDLSPRLYHKLGREKLIAVACVVMFLPGISMMMEGGMYIFSLFDQYAVAGWCIFFIATCECLTIGWMYGADKMCDDIEYMLGYQIPRMWFKICWKFVAPVTTLFIMIYSLAKYEPIKYDRTYVYPTWANFLGWMLALSSMIWIPGAAVYQFGKAKGSSLWQKLTSSVKTPSRWEAIRNGRKLGEKEDEELQLNILTE